MDNEKPRRGLLRASGSIFRCCHSASVLPDGSISILVKPKRPSAWRALDTSRLSDAVRLVEKELSVAIGGLGILIDSDLNRFDMRATPPFMARETSCLL